MGTTIYLIRHGESIGNVQKRFLGHADWDLTELGHRQAACTATLFSDIHVDAIISSDLLRAYHTATPIAASKGLPIQKDKAFREIYAGKWETKPFDELVANYPETYGLWRQDVGKARPDGGESVEELHTRIHKALCRVAAEHPGECVVIATHATPIRVLLTGFSGLPISETARIPWVSNASVTKLTYEDGVFRVEYQDRHDHLGALTTVLPANV